MPSSSMCQMARWPDLVATTEGAPKDQVNAYAQDPKSQTDFMSLGPENCYSHTLNQAHFSFSILFYICFIQFNLFTLLTN